MTKCNKSKCLISVVAVFVFIFAYDFLVHGVLLADAYAATASLWRPQAEMQSMMWMCFVFHGLLAFLFSALYKKTVCSCDTTACSTETKGCTKSTPLTQGICFGAILGSILGVVNGAAYMHLPIPASLAISWFAAYLGQGIGVGVILSCINSKKSCGTK